MQFTIRNQDGTPGKEVSYTALIYIAGGVTHRLALHVVDNVWVVSHPIVGAKVLSVRSNYDAYARRDFHGLRSARQLAIRSLDALLERIGSEKFNTVLATQLSK